VFNNLHEKGSNIQRRPRVKSNIMARLQNNPHSGDRHTSFSSDDRDRHHDEITTEQELITTTETVKPVLRIVPDGRSPRVKSNILKQGTNRKHHQKKKFKGSGRRKFGRSLDLGGDSINEIDTDTVDQEEFDVDFEDDVFDNIDNNDDDEEYTEPEVRPDGRKPRIKSNILAKKSMNGDNNHKRSEARNTRIAKVVSDTAKKLPRQTHLSDHWMMMRHQQTT